MIPLAGVPSFSERGTDIETRLINTTEELKLKGATRNGVKREGVREGEGRASLQIATPHCGVTPACYDTAPASRRNGVRARGFSSPSFVSSPLPPSPPGRIPPFPLARPLPLRSLCGVGRLRAEDGRGFLHACKRAFTPITRLFRCK